MKILVGYATKSGQTTTVAQWIADELRAQGHEVDLHTVEDNPDPADYEAAIVGSSIRAEKWIPPGVNWLTEHAEALTAIPVATFTCSLAVASGKPSIVTKTDRYTEKMLTPLELQPRVHRSMAGAFDPAAVSATERMMMIAMGMRSPVDHRDEDAARSFAQEACRAFNS